MLRGQQIPSENREKPSEFVWVLGRRTQTVLLFLKPIHDFSSWLL